ncbi:MAG: Fur family transcriptional regulator [Stenomitos frigidus ULC029]
MNHNIDALKTERSFPLTRHQRRVLSLLALLEQAVSAQALHIALQEQPYSIGLATVYRALEALKLRGFVQSRTVTKGEALYSLVEQDRHYLTCLQCGQSLPLEACPIHQMEAQLRRSVPFKIYYHTLEFFGLCEPCTQQVDAEV